MNLASVAKSATYAVGFILMLAGTAGTLILLGFVWWSWADEFQYVNWAYDVPCFSITIAMVALGSSLVRRALKRA